MANFFTNKIKSHKEFNIGDWTYGLPTVLRFNPNATLKIGKYCAIADNVTIMLGGEHRVNSITTYPFDIILRGKTWADYNCHTEIGNDVWIGYGATILTGVKIGDGAIIGAKALVSKDILPYTVVAGNPIREIRLRYSPDTANKLIKIAWWNWNDKKIQENMDLLISDKIEEFIDKYYVN